MAITAALGVAIALAFPRLRWWLWAYIAAVAFTRVMFGAHFPLDVVAGTAMGAGSALLAAAYFDRRRGGTSEPVDLDKDDVAAVMPSHGDVPERAHVHERPEPQGRPVGPWLPRARHHHLALGQALLRRPHALRSHVDRRVRREELEPHADCHPRCFRRPAQGSLRLHGNAPSRRRL